MEFVKPSDESRVLVIYTGGTIGMLVGPQGYVPEPHFLTETLRSQARFHDPLQDSLFSNSASVEGYRVWSSAGGSGKSSPRSMSPGRHDATGSPALPAVPHPTLPVRSPRPIGHPATLAPGTTVWPVQQPLCRKISDDIYEAHLPSLVTPKSNVPGGGVSKRIRYAILEWSPLLDSSNIETEDWIRMATEIELNYSFDAFVILHGTEKVTPLITMAYSASALSFLLEDLGKTVIITGAQIPLSQLRNDAIDNLMGALSIAGYLCIPECCLFFNHTLYRGNRVSKTSSYSFDAFASPNFPPLVNVGIDIVVNWNNVIRQTGLRRFRAHKEMSPHVATLRLFPGIAAATVRAFLIPPIRGVILETFGAGNAPQRTDLMVTLKEACDRGVVIVAISQCAKGTVNDEYEVGRTLLEAGVVPGGDMTPECALTKLRYLLSKRELSPEEVRTFMGVPLRGEVTLPAGKTLTQPKIDENLDTIQRLLSQFIRLSRPPPQGPIVTISQYPVEGAAQDAAAPWSWTAAEAVSAEAALLPFLVHMAAARDDVESITFCLANDEALSPEPSPQQWGAPGGIVNFMDPASGRSPLHVAALNGSTNCVNILLKSGASVHLRDSLGHTALYYAARQGHESTVEILIQAGANLGGFDVEGGFVKLAIESAQRSGNHTLLNIWQKTGTQVSIKNEK